MKWKCNTYGCEHTFEDDTTEEELEKDEFITPLCPKCKDPNNRCYRND